MFIDSFGSLFASPFDSYTNSIATIDHGLYKYDGATVTKVLQLSDRECIWGIDDDSSGYIYAGIYSLNTINNAKIYKSIDGGDNWTEVYDGGAWRHCHAIEIDKSNNYVYAAFGDSGSTNKTYRSTDGGVTWNTIINGSIPYQYTAILATSNYRFFGSDQSGYGTILRTSDDNTTETVLNTHYQNVFFLRQSDITGWIYAGFKLDPSATTNLTADIYISKDEGDTWELYKTLTSLTAGEGFWFASEFRNGQLIISSKTSGAFQDLIVLSEQ